LTILLKDTKRTISANSGCSFSWKRSKKCVVQSEAKTMILDTSKSNNTFSETLEELIHPIRKPIWLSWPLIGNTFLTSSPELQHEKSPDLAEIFLYRSSKKVATFQSDSKFKMATKASD
jgi:hypothetical protein